MTVKAMCGLSLLLVLRVKKLRSSHATKFVDTVDLSYSNEIPNHSSGDCSCRLCLSLCSRLRRRERGESEREFRRLPPSSDRSLRLPGLRLRLLLPSRSSSSLFVLLFRLSFLSPFTSSTSAFSFSFSNSTPDSSTALLLRSSFSLSCLHINFLKHFSHNTTFTSASFLSPCSSYANGTSTVFNPGTGCASAVDPL